jgi:hypothetical protein
MRSQALVAHACNPSYLGVSDRENCDSRPAQVNRSQDPISKTTRAKWRRGVAQVEKCLLCRHEVLNSNSDSTKKNKKKKQLPKPCPFVFIFETGSQHLAQAGLELATLLPHPFGFLWRLH